MKRTPIVPLALTALLLAVATPQVTSAQTDEALPPAIEELRACIADTRRVDVLIVMDESSSLQTTDPTAARVDGLIGAVDALVSVDERSAGDPVAVTLMLAAFADNFSSVTSSGDSPFVPVSAATRDQLIDDAQEFSSRDDGDLTDFSVAVDGAIVSFAQRATQATADGSVPPCKALLLFTDGELFLETDDDNNAAKDALCRPGGLADLTRSAGIISIAVALVPATSAANTDDPLLMQRVVIGTDTDGNTCGTTGSDRTGVYIEVTDVADLVRQFIIIFEPPPPPPSSCPSDRPCTGTFDIPDLANGFRFRATSPAADPTITFTSPSGATTSFSGDAITTTLDGARLAYRPTSVGGFTIDATTGTAGEGEWAWEIRYPDDSAEQGTPTFSVALTADLEPVLLDPVEAPIGSDTTLRFTVAGPDGPIGTIDNSQLSATVVDELTDTKTPIDVTGPDNDGIWTGTITVGPDTQSNELTIDLDAEITTTSGDDVPVARGSATISLIVVGAIRIGPTKLTPPSITGDGSTTDTITADATGVAGGCVWVRPTTLNSPRDNETVSVTAEANSEENCLRVDENTIAELGVKFIPSAAANGTVTGTIDVGVASDDSNIAERTVVIPVRFEQGPAAQVWWRILAIIVSVLSFMMIALAALHAMAARGARFAQSNRILYWSDNVVLDSGTLRSTDTPDTALNAPPINASYFDALGDEATRERLVDIGRGFELRTVPRSAARPSLRALFLGPSGQLVADSAVPVAAGTTPPSNLASNPKHGTHGVLLSLRNQWVYVADNPADPSSGILVLFISATNPSSSDPSDLIAAATQILRRRVPTMTAPEKHRSPGTPRLSLPRLPRRGPRNRKSGPGDDYFDDLNH